MNFLRRLFAGSGATNSDTAMHMYVRCNRCNAPVHVRIDLRNDLTIEYSDNEEVLGYRLIKEIMDSRCFRLMRAEIEYDSNRREQSRQLEGGTFITKAEYEQLMEQGDPSRIDGR